MPESKSATITTGLTNKSLYGRKKTTGARTVVQSGDSSIIPAATWNAVPFAEVRHLLASVWIQPNFQPENLKLKEKRYEEIIVRRYGRNIGAMGGRNAV